MLELLINKPEFSKELELNAINKAFLMELETIKMYEFYNNRYQNNTFMNVLNARKPIEQLFRANDEVLLVDCPLQDAFIILLAQELKLVQAYKNASLVCVNEELKDLIFRLWASYVNEYQVALRQSLVNANEQGIDSLVNNFLKDILK